MATLLRDQSILEYDVLAIQEPWRNPFISTTHNPVADSFHLFFPQDCRNAPARVCFFINKRLDESTWKVTERTRDICTLTIGCTDQEGRAQEIAIHNVYNPPLSTQNCTSCLPELQKALQDNAESDQMILGDFNLHHGYWGGPEIRHKEQEADDLIDIIHEHGLSSTLIPGTITFDDRNLTSSIDLCFATEGLVDQIVRSGVDQEMDHNSDHLPITTILDIRGVQTTPPLRRDWKSTDEKKLHEILREHLPELRRPGTKTALEQYVKDIEGAIREAIEGSTPMRRSSPKSKAGWTQQCKSIQAEARRLKRQNSRENTEQSWEEYRVVRNQKGRVIKKALRQAHRQSVEEASQSPQGMWRLTRWARRRGERTVTTTPVLRNPRTDETFSEPEGKTKLLKETFFPTPPEADIQDIRGISYNDQIELPPITEWEVQEAILQTPPMKAPGPDGIINKILHALSPHIAPHLTRIFNQCLKLGHCPSHFRQSLTVVLRKPGKDDYTIPKAYRPIALLNTMGKIMDAIIARRLSYLVEQHQLLPQTHTGGRKARSTEHAMHVIIEKIYEAWNHPNGQVASLLLLDVSGAFDNVSHERLLHNLRKRNSRFPRRSCHQGQAQ